MNIRKRKILGKPYLHLLKKKILVPSKIKIDPKKEAKKSKVEKKADELLKKLANQE